MKRKKAPLFTLVVILGIFGFTSFMFHPTLAFSQAKKALVDLNKATDKELESLKGVGPATAKKIIEGRPYKSVDELTKAGITGKKLEELKPLVTVGSAPPAAKAAGVQEKALPKTAPSPEKTVKPEKAKSTAPKLAPGQKVNINSAGMADIEALPGIGPSKAQAIIDGRPYQKIEDVMKVKGIKEGIFNKIKDSITVK